MTPPESAATARVFWSVGISRLRPASITATRAPEVSQSRFLSSTVMKFAAASPRNVALTIGLEDYMRRVRSFTSLPLAVGFGISTPGHVRETSALADGVIVASALINHIDSVPEGQQAAAAEAFVRLLAAATAKGDTQQAGGA